MENIKEKLYGMCYLLEERGVCGNKFDVQAEARLMKNLGVKTVRQWLHVTYLMKNPRQFLAKRVKKTHELLAACEREGMQNIGLNHCNFNKGKNACGKPARDISKNSYYVRWLERYRESWYNLVKEFPEISYWEVDNELNNPDFMCGINGERDYSLEEMAEISLDVMYYAADAIRAANPAAKVIIGGLTEPEGLGKGNLKEFLKLFYTKMKSGNFGYRYFKEPHEAARTEPDAYFDIMCWHPYVWDAFDENYFIQKNNEYYGIVKKYEGKEKPVYFTEMGFNDEGVGEEESIKRMTAFFGAAAKLPYVETVNYYKLYDVGRKDCFEGNGTYSRFGLFYDPEPRSYPDCNGITVINGAPKQKAYAFQRLAGGSGDLDALVIKE